MSSCWRASNKKRALGCRSLCCFIFLSHWPGKRRLPIPLSLSVGWAVGMATQVLAAAFYRSSRKFLMVLLGKPCQGFSRIFVKLLQKIPGAKVS